MRVSSKLAKEIFDLYHTQDSQQALFQSAELIQDALDLSKLEAYNLALKEFRRSMTDICLELKTDFAKRQVKHS